MKMHLLFGLFILLTRLASANVCGTDFQIFNPTTNGLDFVTVQSSETLRPCIVNTGFFANYAVNSLVYSQTLNSKIQAGDKSKDRTLGLDMSVGMGINDRWDFGINIPVVVSQSVEDDFYLPTFDQTGVTEIKANTKYRLWGDERRGLAGILSINQNLIKDNPITGKDPGLTFNYELAADTTFFDLWAVGVNFGYRDRNPGDAIAGMPFIPLKDQWIYSFAASYLITKLDTKIIGEIYGSHAAKKVNTSIDRSLNSLEGLIGVKYDYNQNTALHFGVAKQIDTSLGGPDWRVYAGLNWAWGPVCDTTDVSLVEVTPPPVPHQSTVELPPTEIYTMDVELLFATNKDQLNNERLGMLDDFAKKLVEKGYDHVVIEGHTDSVGEDDYNLDLSRRRAGNVRRHLVEKHKIPEAKIQSVGFGETQPIADNGNYQGRKKNRRVEFKIWR